MLRERARERKVGTERTIAESTARSALPFNEDVVIARDRVGARPLLRIYRKQSVGREALGTARRVRRRAWMIPTSVLLRRVDVEVDAVHGRIHSCATPQHVHPSEVVVPFCA